MSQTTTRRFVAQVQRPPRAKPLGSDAVDLPVKESTKPGERGKSELHRDALAGLDLTKDPNKPDGVAAEGVPARKLEPIGLGRPLRVRFERIYLGSYHRPKRLLVTSQVKNPVIFAGGAECMNLYTEEVEHHSTADFGAGLGSTVIYYSPSASDTQLAIDVRLNIDNFNPAAARKWIDVGASAAGLPAFLGSGVGGQAIVKAVGVAAKLAVNLIDHLVDPDSADRRFGFELNLDDDPFGGIEQAGYVLLIAPNDQDPNDPWYGTPKAYGMAPGVEYQIRGSALKADDGRLIDRLTPGREYFGDFPYVLLSVDGKADDKLAKWKSAAVTASVSAQFRTTSEDQVVDDAAAAVEAYSDLLTVRSVEDARKKLAAATDETVKERLKKEVDALVGQIQDDSLKDLAAGKG